MTKGHNPMMRENPFMVAVADDIFEEQKVVHFNNVFNSIIDLFDHM